MSFLSKLKHLAGISTLDVCLSVPPRFSAAEAVVAGTIHLIAKSDQAILRLTVELRAIFTSGCEDDSEQQTLTLGTVELNESFQLHTGERRDVRFAVPFHLNKLACAQLQQQCEPLGGPGKAGTWTSADNSTYQLVATVAVRGRALPTGATADLRLVA